MRLSPWTAFASGALVLGLTAAVLAPSAPLGAAQGGALPGLHGGQLSAGPCASGGYVVRATLPAQ